MSKRPNNQETLRLSLELLKRIPRHRKISASELHQQLTDAGFERSRRTIERQLQMLCDEFDIECDDGGKPYGYRWKEMARPLSVPTLNAQESLLLTLAEQYLHNLLPSRLMKSMKGFFDQARYELSGSKKESQWLKKVRVVAESQPLLAPDIKPGIVETVSSALYGNCWLTLKYRNAAGHESDIEVMPLGMVQQGSRLYLVCRYKGFDNERSLALHRIQKARAQTLTFDSPKEFDLKKYDEDGRFGFGDGVKIQLSFTITKAAGSHLYETPMSKDQKIVDKGNSLRVTATVIDSGQLEWWLNGFGDQISKINIKKLTQ